MKSLVTSGFSKENVCGRDRADDHHVSSRPYRSPMGPRQVADEEQPAPEWHVELIPRSLGPRDGRFDGELGLMVASVRLSSSEERYVRRLREGQRTRAVQRWRMISTESARPQLRHEVKRLERNGIPESTNV